MENLMIKRLIILFKLGRKVAKSDILSIVTKFQEPPFAIKILFKILSFSFSQKKELRQIKRLIDEKFFQEAESTLESNKDFLLSGDSKTDAQFYYYATKIYTEIKSFKQAKNSLEELMSINPSYYNAEMKLDYKNLEEILVVALVNAAVADN